MGLIASVCEQSCQIIFNCVLFVSNTYSKKRPLRATQKKYQFKKGLKDAMLLMSIPLPYLLAI